MVEITDIVDRLPGDLASPHRQSRPVGAIRTIVVHYDAVSVPDHAGEGCLGYSPVERYSAQARYHMGKNWNEGAGPVIHGFGLMYHYRISADGHIWQTQPEELVTWHARAANYSGLAVCCDLGPGQAPAGLQLAGLKALLEWLCFSRPDIPAGRADVWGHGEMAQQGNHTACPGGILEWVQEYRKSGA